MSWFDPPHFTPDISDVVSKIGSNVMPECRYWASLSLLSDRLPPKTRGSDRLKTPLSFNRFMTGKLVFVGSLAYDYNNGMKNLHQSLIDYDMALLQAIADCRVVSIETSSHAQAVNQLVENMLSPVASAITLADLSQAEHKALQFLLNLGGQVDGPRFAREFGAVRTMGPARLLREQPWQNPVNPAEGLWYRGLIFKAFQVTEQGGQEIVYIPDDLRPLLKLPAPQPSSPAAQHISHAATPPVVISGSGRLRENFFRLLVYLQTNPIRLENRSELSIKAKQSLTACLLPPPHTLLRLVDELDFIIQLGLRTDLLTIAHGRLRPDRDPIRSWLQADQSQQVQLLQQAWRTDPTWNDLWHVPGLVPQPTGWENSPLRARSKIVGYLEQLVVPSDNWFAIDDFVSTIKQLDPDFQRPGGEYDGWYIKDEQGNFLMGFEHWDDVEGGLIRYLLTHVLLWLGAVEVGCLADTSSPHTFRMTRLGVAFLENQSLPTDPPGQPVYFRVDNQLQVRVPAQASLYDRFQLARFAEQLQHESKRTVYQITQASIGKALKNGVTPDQIIAFLTRITNNRIPLKVVETTRAWGTRRATVQIEQATLLRLKNEQLVAELHQHPALSQLLGEVVGPKTIIVPAHNVAEVRRLLTELGYLG
jgi:hypothetical protein